MLTDREDLALHGMIDLTVEVLSDLRRQSRTEILGGLHRCARNRSLKGEQFEHAIEAILHKFKKITRSDLAERIQAVIELDQEEEEERARKAQTNTEAQAG